MRKAGRLAAEILDALAPHVVPGVSTQELDDIVYKMTIDAGALPATLGYRGYTKSCCISINHVVCHGIPGEKALKNGDIVNIDVTPIVDGWHGDTSRMYGVGDVPRKAQRLMDITHEAMMRGIAAVKPGATLGDLGHAIQSYAEGERCSVVREFCGHGLGRQPASPTHAFEAFRSVQLDRAFVAAPIVDAVILDVAGARHTPYLAPDARGNKAVLRC
jgi:methionyl aminopeptidase